LCYDAINFMFIKLKNLKIHYKVTGSGDPVILLPGWGRDISYFNEPIRYLSQNFKVYAIDLPGFGLSTKPETAWGGKEYADLVKNFVDELKINDPILLGHSFGGKVVINLVAHNLIQAKRVILISSSGIQLSRSLKVKIKIYCFKLLKLLVNLPIIKTAFASRFELYRKRLGSDDYKNAFGIMRSILVKSLRENVIKLLPKIKIPTLLVWGDMDNQTPLRAGQIMQQNIQNSQLRVISGTGHFPFLDNWEEVKVELDKFL